MAADIRRGGAGWLPAGVKGRSGMDKTYDLICMGMGLVDSILRGFRPEPVAAAGYLADSNTLAVGGEAVNAACAAAKLGLRTALVCALGEDEAGSMVLHALERDGVDLSRIRKGPATPVSTIFVREDGTRKSIINDAHRYQYHPERDPASFTDARVLHLGSLFRAPFDDPEVILGVLQAAKAAGETVIADTKLPRGRAMGLAEIRDCLPLIDYLTHAAQQGGEAALLAQHLYLQRFQFLHGSDACQGFMHFLADEIQVFADIHGCFPSKLKRPKAFCSALGRDLF